MFDFINIEITNLLPSEWLENPILKGSGFPLEVIEETGEILAKKRIAEYKGLCFKLLPSTKKTGGYAMVLSGSVHKYRNEGLYNYDRFTLHDCVQVINELFVKFGIEPTKTALNSLEFGVNLNLSYSPQKVIKSVVAHRNQPYEAIEKNRRNGVVCVRDGYEIKIYDKGFVSRQPQGNILRIEYKMLNMRELDTFKIRYLSDLCNSQKVVHLLDLLIGVLDDTVFIPHDTNTDGLTAREQIVFHAMGKPSSWKELTRKQRFDKRLSLSRILKKCNAFDYQKDLKIRVADEWKTLLDVPIEANKNVTFTPHFLESEALENVTFTPLEYRVQTLRNPIENEEQKKCRKIEVLKLPKRCCLACGKDISMNRVDSVFCSVKYNSDAKQCRNKDSNKRRTLKAQIMRATNKNKWLRITYKNPEQPDQEFTDTLHSSEITVNRGWLNTIVRIEILHEAPTLYGNPNEATPEILTGNEAVKMLEELTNENTVN
jgi:hypothetical protein